MRPPVRRLCGVLVLFSLTAVGCQHSVLQRRVNQQASRLPDLYYGQVLDNIAMFSQDPASIPHFAYASAGTTQVQRTAGANANVGFTGTLEAFFFSAFSVSPNASQVVSESWTTAPSVEPEELYLMRSVYQRTLGVCPAEGEAAIQAFFGQAHVGLPAMQPGWYCVGGKHDVPKCAAYVGHHCDTYVWVTHEQVDSLSRLVIAMTDIATADTSELTKRTGDKTGSRIQELQQQIQYLSGILKDYPDKTTPEAKLLRSKLDKDILELLGRKTKKEDRAQLRENYLEHFPDAEKKTRGGLFDKAMLAADKAPETLPTSPLPARVRKPQFAPLLPPPLQPLGSGQ